MARQWSWRSGSVTGFADSSPHCRDFKVLGKNFCIYFVFDEILSVPKTYFGQIAILKILICLKWPNWTHHLTIWSHQRTWVWIESSAMSSVGAWLSMGIGSLSRSVDIGRPTKINFKWPKNYVKMGHFYYYLYWAVWLNWKITTIRSGKPKSINGPQCNQMAFIFVQYLVLQQWKIVNSISICQNR